MKRFGQGKGNSSPLNFKIINWYRFSFLHTYTETKYLFWSTPMNTSPLEKLFMVKFDILNPHSYHILNIDKLKRKKIFSKYIYDTKNQKKIYALILCEKFVTTWGKEYRVSKMSVWRFMITNNRKRIYPIMPRTRLGLYLRLNVATLQSFSVLSSVLYFCQLYFLSPPLPSHLLFIFLLSSWCFSSHTTYSSLFFGYFFLPSLAISIPFRSLAIHPSILIVIHIVRLLSISWDHCPSHHHTVSGYASL